MATVCSYYTYKTEIDSEDLMPLTDLELMHKYVEDDSPQGLRSRRRTLESWIAAGFLTPAETNEAGRVLKILRERVRGNQKAA